MKHSGNLFPGFVSTGAACLAMMTSPAALADDAAPLTITIGKAVQQMKIPHEAIPYGVPASYNWRTQPVVYGISATARNFRAMTGWGQIFRASGTDPISLRVSLRNLRTYVLTTSGKLKLVQSENSFDGAQFRTDYKYNRHTQANTGRDQQGNTVVTTNPFAAFHFWPASARAAIDPQAVRGVIVTLEAKLDPEPGSKVADLSKRLVLSVGADYWLAMDSEWDNYRTNLGVGEGRFEYVGTQWKCFTMTTITREDARILSTEIQC
ncbi:hypothetical protein SAMN02787142_2520 [Burkholderia sp. WP9]|uniref:hypothetical protein n=1 Tax=Burkholderia sp. WP9 TaxID=1500263 RepID=UPI00089973D6|nr:hypothetical protein [Burkholderia sp. WP9]SED08525.1 hypothetical protein SAMN02787142_2520 [Burkholderia sp. WP9]